MTNIIKIEKTIPLLILLMCISYLPISAQASGLWVSTTTDNSSYNIGEIVGLSGTGSFVLPKGTIYAYFEIFNPNGEMVYQGSYPISSDGTWTKPIGYTIQQNSVLGTYKVESRAIEYDSDGYFVSQSSIYTTTFEVGNGGGITYTTLHITVKKLDGYDTISGSEVSLNGVKRGSTDSYGNIDLQVETNTQYLILASKTGFNSRSMTEFVYSDEKSTTVYLTPIDDPIDPIALAGQDQIVDEGTVVTLSAASSYDSDGNIVSYEWKENGNILSSSVSFSKDFSVGIHEITLKVIDNSSATDTDIVTIKVDPVSCGNVNLFSYITAGGNEDHNMKVDKLTFSNDNPLPGEKIKVSIEWSGLDCSSCIVKANVFGDWDKSNAIAQFYSGSNSGGSATIDITMPQREDTYKLRFIWAFDIGSYSDYFSDNLPSESQCDTWGDSKTVILDKVITVSDEPLPPVANAGVDIVRQEGDNIKLDASKSYDLDGTIISYRWIENGITISKDISTTKIFKVGTHELTLKVTDDSGLTDEDILWITVNPKSVYSEKSNDNSDSNNQEDINSPEENEEIEHHQKDEFEVPGFMGFSLIVSILFIWGTRKFT